MTATVTSIQITKTSDQARADKLANLLNGRTYMDLKVIVAPCMGELHISVQTTRPDTTAEELTEMVLAVMAGDLMRG